MQSFEGHRTIYVRPTTLAVKSELIKFYVKLGLIALRNGKDMATRTIVERAKRKNLR